jgi:hypothetical protein
LTSLFQEHSTSQLTQHLRQKLSSWSCLLVIIVLKEWCANGRVFSKSKAVAQVIDKAVIMQSY